jgi:hypothetical protein
MKRRALSARLTHRNKTEMPYQVMRNIADNRYNHRSINSLTNRPMDQLTYTQNHVKLGCEAISANMKNRS